MVPLIKRVVAKAIAADMDAVKAYCEGALTRPPAVKPHVSTKSGQAPDR